MPLNSAEPQEHALLIEKLTIAILPTSEDTILVPAAGKAVAHADQDRAIGVRTAAAAPSRLVAAAAQAATAPTAR